MIPKETQNSFTFCGRNPVYPFRKTAVHINELTPTFGMFDDYRVRGVRCSWAKGRNTVVPGSKPFEIILHSVRKALISGIHTCKHCIAATVWGDNLIVKYTTQRRQFGAGLVCMPDMARDFW